MPRRLSSLFFSILLLLLPQLMASPVSAAEIVVDTHDPSVKVTGSWTAYAATAGPGGADYLYHRAGDGSDTVFWPVPASAAPGRYELFARWTGGPDRAHNAPYQVVSAADISTIALNQTVNGASWQSLGSYDFAPGANQGVTLSDNADGVVIANAVRFVGPSNLTGMGANPSAAATPSATTSMSNSTSPWVVTLDTAPLYAGPNTTADQLAEVPQFSYLQVLDYSGDFAYVYNPRAHGTAYIASTMLGPSDPPPGWVTAPPPPATQTINQMGRTVGRAPLAYYPIADKFAVTQELGHNASVLIRDVVTGDDGSPWYRTDQGGYLASDSVRLPGTPTRTYPGRWIDADLREPSLLTAYEGDRPIMTTLTIRGTVANQTPLGVFAIQRRVADETMDSGTLGVPASAPGGYHLEHVLWTQYFTSDGASIHYNYWSANFGYSASHGCLGLPYDESRFLWGWAGIGTPVVIRNGA